MERWPLTPELTPSEILIGPHLQPLTYKFSPSCIGRTTESPSRTDSSVEASEEGSCCSDFTNEVMMTR